MALSIWFLLPYTEERSRLGLPSFQLAVGKSECEAREWLMR
jgi:hypothetical protein